MLSILALPKVLQKPPDVHVGTCKFDGQDECQTATAADLLPLYGGQEQHRAFAVPPFGDALSKGEQHRLPALSGIIGITFDHRTMVSVTHGGPR